MSKQTNDQDDAQKTPAEASQSDATSSSSASSVKTANQQQRRGKGSANTSSKPSGQQNSAKGSQSAAQPASTQSTKTDSAANNSATTKGSAANKDNATASPSAAASGAGTPTDAVPQQGSGGGGSKSGIFAIVLVVVLAVALAFLAWEGWQRLENQQQRLDELAQKTDNSATQADLAELNERLESGEAERNQALESTTNEMQQAFSEYRSEVNDTLDQVLDQLSQEQDADEREWLHAEAAYLLRLANQRLQLERDVEGAAALLRTADSVLNSADNPALTPVRREIASELAALDAVPRVDRTGIYLALNAQQERIATLRLDQEVEEQPVSSNMEEPPTGTFQRQLARFGEELKDLVVVRGHDEAMEVLITPEQESYLRQSLRLILEQSQLAVLKEEQELFEAGIDKALDLLNRYYDTSRSETQGVISRLEEIRQTNVTPELPDISRSQQALAEFIENRYESRGGES
ncbi:uroporphyrinogen-III C-methyltransferase [Vreelandella aquamarina]|uniref:uroporphyrinogen-III C-methyltransferase n=1 Tax=Vreelandella aquamarina TaxID=77097 RepID=UPI00384A745E